MREHLRRDRTTPLRDIIDRGINETLGLSRYPPASALLAMLPMAIWGGTGVESVAVSMVVWRSPRRRCDERDIPPRPGGRGIREYAHCGHAPKAKEQVRKAACSLTLAGF